MINKKRAFTIAEALIVLGVLGVVVIMTLPTAIANYQEHALVAKQKAFASDMILAIQNVLLNENGSLNKPFYNSDKTEITKDLNEHFLRERFAQGMKLIKICKADEPETSDIYHKKCGFDGLYKTAVDIDGTKKIDILSLTNKDIVPVYAQRSKNKEQTSKEEIIKNDFSGAVNADEKFAPALSVNGTSILLAYNPKCTKLNSENGIREENVCLNIVYDVNGISKPNQVGKDIGFVTVFYPKDPRIAAPVINKNGIIVMGDKTPQTKEDAKEYCKNNNSGKLPTPEETWALRFNSKLLGYENTADYWSSKDTLTTNQNVTTEYGEENGPSGLKTVCLNK